MLSKVLFTAATACGLFVSSVNAHMVITSPVPYGASSLTNSPLEPDGSDFPCKQRSGVYDITTMNNMPVGVPQKLEFKGGATHGGGSCQVSVTLDKQPSKDSDWRVIHSIIGGCPTSVAGNADGSPNYKGTDLNHFEFSVPKGMPNGEYTLAWTWFNKIGNREMYMNCAPITVTGGADNNDVYDTLPPMFKANVPASQCTTTEGKDLVFPNPGAYSETSPGAAPGGPSGPSCGASGPSNYGGSSGNSSDAPPGGSYSAPIAASSAASAPTGRPAHLPFRGGAAVNGGLQPTTLQTIPASAPTSPAEGGASTTPPSSDAVSSDTPSAAPPSYQAPSDAGSSDTPTPAPPSYQAPSSGAGNSSASSGSCSGSSVSCPSPGNVVCIGSSQWGLCDINNCAVPRELSAGTSCSNGVVAKRHVLEHVRRHAHHARKL